MSKVSAPSKRRTFVVSLNRADGEALAALAEEAGITPEQQASVWIRDELRQAAVLDALRALGSSTALHQPQTVAAGSTGQDAAAKSNGRPRPALHEEISAVLGASSAPMTVSEIAAEVRARGLYTSPRTGRPITTESISARVANPNYRSLYKRSGRLLTLADTKRRGR